MLNFGLGIEALIILTLIVINGLFAMSEIAVISARKTRLRHRASGGDARAAKALALAEHPNRLLSTAQIGITLVGIFAGAYAGATVAGNLDELLQRVSLFAPFSEQLALAIVVLIVTYLSLVLGELVPKRLALTYPEAIAAAVAGLMYRLSVIAAPLVHVLSVSTDGVLRLLRVQNTEEPPVTEEEITSMIRLGTEIGVFHAGEQDLVERVFRLGDQTVASLMTPRERIICLDVLDPPEVNRRKMIRHRVQRFLLCEGTLDKLLGMVPVTELWARMLAGEPLDLRAAVQAPLSIPETMHALGLLELFRESGVHLALVVDVHHRITGLVTLTDILQEISGALSRAAEPRIVQRHDGSWLMDGSLAMRDVWQTLHVPAAEPAELDGQRITLGSFVVERIAHVPISGEYFEAAGHRFEVVDMDGSHVDKVLISRIDETP